MDEKISGPARGHIGAGGRGETFPIINTLVDWWITLQSAGPPSSCQRKPSNAGRNWWVPLLLVGNWL